MESVILNYSIIRRLLREHQPCKKVLSTLEPTTFSPGQEYKCTIDDKEFILKEGVDFFRSTTSKARATKAVPWL